MQEQVMYYTPSIEDIRVGYIYEEKDNQVVSSRPTDMGTSLILGCKHVTKKINNRHDLTQVISYLETGNINDIRTPYLTKEQIEKEGWVFDNNISEIDFNFYAMEFENGRRQYFLYHSTKEEPLKIEKCIDCGVEGHVFVGNCPSINELRYISRLIGI